jgi:hypothetical protein
MIIYLFRDKDADDIFALTTDVTGTNIPLVTQTTDWLFQEVLDSIEFANPWDIGEFRDVLDRLKADGFYLFQGSLIRVVGCSRADTEKASAS